MRIVSTGSRRKRERSAHSTTQNVLDVHDIGTHEGVPFIVSELLEGETLRQHMSRGSVPTPRALDFAKQIATGLAVAHDKGIIHRDLKPENVFVTNDGRIKILDFGLAKVTKPEHEGSSGSDSVTETVDTKAGTLLGTVAYMSPEQIRGLPADRRSDVFSFGVILYELLLGSRPFKGDTPVDTMTAILTKDPFDVPDSIRGLTQPLQRVIGHCLEKKPEGRFQSARDVLFALETFSSLQGPTGAATRTHRRMSAPVALVALGVLVLAGTAGFFIGRRIAVSSAANPVFQQLTARRGFIFSGRFTPDGQSVVYGAAWDGRPVELFTTPASRAESTPLPIPSADVLSVSTSGELAISLGRRYVDGFATSGTLARGIAGTAPREILEGVQDADWDGNEELAIIRRVGGRHRLEWPIGRVLRSTAGWISHARLSPKRDLVAFFEHPVHGDDRGVVAIIDRQGATRILSDGWASVNGLAWSSSTGEVWASRGGTRRELFGVSLAGKVRPLWRGAGSVMLYDVAPDGRLLLGQESVRSIVAGLASGERDERDLSWTDFSLGHDLSIDGRTVLLSEGGVGTGPLYDAYLRRMDGSPATRLGEGQPMALSPDQRWVLVLLLRSPPELLLLLRLYGISGGAATIVPGLAAGEAPLLWSRDGNALFTVERLGATRMRVHKVDLRTQRKTLVRDIAPPIAGLMSILHVHAADDARAYVYSYWQRLTDLYLVEGIR